MRRWMKIIRETPAIGSLWMVLAMFVGFAFFLNGNGADTAVIKSVIGVISVGTLLLVGLVLMRTADERATRPSDEPST
jgi:uncharacterized membrane protein